VIGYLLAEFDQPELKDGSRLPPIRTLAAHLDVSVQTIHGALRKLEQQGRIRMESGKGSFLVSASRSKPEHLRIALSVPTSAAAKGGDWASRIAHGIFQATLDSKRPVTLVPFPSELEGTDAAKRKLLDECSEVDGLILFPYSLSPQSQRDEVCEVYERSGKPVVHVLPPTDTAVSNFVSLDYYGPSFRLAQAWRQTGRRRFLLLHADELKTSVSARLRLAGFVTGLGDGLGAELQLRVLGCKEDPGDGRPRGLRDLWSEPSGGWDAVYCLSGLIAPSVVACLSERGLHVPNHVSVVGVGLGGFYPGIEGQPTVIFQPVESLGMDLLRLLIQRIDQDGVSLPARFIATPFIGGATTRPEENELLRVQSSPNAREATGKESTAEIKSKVQFSSGSKIVEGSTMYENV
jgi:DNA-binding LacI/PurR family transcriptional regulator